MLRLILCFIFLISTTAIADECVPSFYEKYVTEYLDELESYSTSVFYNKTVHDGETLTLVIEVGSYDGLLIEHDDCTITNVALISYSKKYGKFIVMETQGGVWSYDHTAKTLTVMTHEKFTLLPSSELNELRRMLIKEK